MNKSVHQALDTCEEIIKALTEMYIRKATGHGYIPSYTRTQLTLYTKTKDLELTMNLEPGIDTRLTYKFKGFLFKQVYTALRFSRNKNKVVTQGVYWDCGFSGVKKGHIK